MSPSINLKELHFFKLSSDFSRSDLVIHSFYWVSNNIHTHTHHYWQSLTSRFDTNIGYFWRQHMVYLTDPWGTFGCQKMRQRKTRTETTFCRHYFPILINFTPISCKWYFQARYFENGSFYFRVSQLNGWDTCGSLDLKPFGLVDLHTTSQHHWSKKVENKKSIWT